VRAAAVAAFLTAVLSSAPALAQAAEPSAAQHLAAIPLTIRAHGRVQRFRVETARSWHEQEVGLMFRPTIPADRGMLFYPYPPEGGPPRFASFWMKNTMAPLDIVFIRPDRTISSIAADATPYSLTPIPSVEPVGAILELKGGEAARRGIRAGDRVAW
jgi:uncharacterized protein